jgi:putative membrane protein
MWGWGNGAWGWGMWIPMMLFMVAFLAVIVWAVVMLTRSWTTHPPHQGHIAQGPDPKGILDERFARGEIDEEEYLKRRGVLQQGK